MSKGSLQISDVQDLSGELLEGAGALAVFFYGSDSFKERRKIYHLVEGQRLPTFRIGKKICARRSTLQTWIIEQEKAGRAGHAEAQLSQQG
jgi:hypothetical protein